MLSVIMLCVFGITNVHAEETILDGTLDSFEEGTYMMKDEEGDGYWEIIITDNDVAIPNYTEYWSSGNFSKTVSANYYNGGSLEVTMQAVFTGKITAGGGSSIYSVYDGYFQSTLYSTLSSSCVVLRSNSTPENPAMGRYSQSVRKISNNENKTFKLTLSLSYYGAATITITC